MLSFHCKITDPVAFRKPLEKYIVDMEHTKEGGKSKKPRKQMIAPFEADIQAIEAARTAARNSTASSGGEAEAQANITQYYYVIKAIENKLPINESQIRIAFTWQDSVRKGKKCSRFDVGMDMVGFMFNYAALSSQMGSKADRAGIEGLKISCKHFQEAAGMLVGCGDLVQTRALGALTVDLSVEAVALMKAAMLAQAQHCFCEKAVRDGLSPALLSKLCQGTADLFSEAHAYFSNQQIAANYNKTWSGLMKMHVHHYTAKVHHHEARGCHKAEKFGEEIARLRMALGEIHEAKEQSKVANTQAIAASFLSELESAVVTELNSVEKDNNIIYNMPIPQAHKLNAVKGKVMVKPIPVDQILKPPEDLEIPFGTLLPAAAAAALADYHEKVKTMVEEHGKLVAVESSNANSVIAELNLEALLASGEEGLPMSMAEDVHEIASKGGMNNLTALMEQVKMMSSTNQQIAGGLGPALDEEERMDREMRSQYPQMQERISPSAAINEQLRSQVHGMNQKLRAAADADQLVQSKLRQHRDAFGMISEGPDAIAAQCPRPGNSMVNPAADLSLQLVAEAAEKMEIVLGRRDNYMSKLNTLMEGDDAESMLSNSTDASYTDTLERAMGRYDAVQRDIASNIAQQEDHISTLLEHTAKAREGQDGASIARDEYLRDVSVAINAYREVMANLKEGLEWHSKFQETLSGQQQRIQDFAVSRRMEKQMFAEGMTRELAGMGPAPGGVTAIPHGGGRSGSYSSRSGSFSLG